MSKTREELKDEAVLDALEFLMCCTTCHPRYRDEKIQIIHDLAIAKEQYKSEN